MITNIDNSKISNFNDLFLSASLNDINQTCKILNGDFFLDSFNYFPITLKYETFYDLFKRQDDNSLNHFYNEEFYDNIKGKEKDFKIFENILLIGSSPSDNYFTNLINFLPRIFFTNQKKINILIHRNLSNKFRNLIKSLCVMREIEITFSYVDDNFYKFKNSKMPQFFNISTSVNILRFFFNKILSNIKSPDFGQKIFIRRENTKYRKILNESELISKLRENGFEIINPHHFEILDQMKIFSNAKIIISSHGSNLSNIIFCKEGTKVIEIGPQLNKSYEVRLSNRYKNLSSILNLQFTKILADTVDITDHSILTKKYINNKILNESNYYKNIILKVSEIDKLINNLRSDDSI